MSRKQKWLVRVRVIYTQEVTVEADGWCDAQHRGEQAGIDLDEAHKQVDGRPLEAIGEPWLLRAGWYDLHGPGDIVVCERSYGHVFEERQIELLRSRLEQLGLEVVDSWNGAGCSKVSFRCRGRQGTDPFTEDERALLCAPLPEGWLP